MARDMVIYSLKLKLPLLLGRNRNIVMAKSTKPRFGLFYRSNGRWTGPYAGLSFTNYTLNRQPLRGDVSWLKNYILKSRIQFRKVTA